MTNSLLPQPFDLAISWSNRTGSGDISVDEVSQDMLLENPLLSSVMVSLFSDRLAPDVLNSVEKTIGILPAGNTSNGFQNPKRGWWADGFSTDKIGSRLWQLQRMVKTKKSSVLLEIQAVVYESLQWMITNGIASNINVTADFSPKNLKIVIFSAAIEQPKNSSPENFTFQLAWNSI